MSSNNESIGKTLAVVVSLCLVCAVIVSLTSVQLRPLQKANKAKDIQSNILAAAGISKVDNVAETFEAKIETRFIDMQSGDFATLTSDIGACVQQIADASGGCRLVSLLEGGYNLDALGQSVCMHLRALEGL